MASARGHAVDSETAERIAELDAAWMLIQLKKIGGWDVAKESTASTEKTPQERLGDIARDCLKEASGDTRKAIAAMTEVLMKNRPLLQELIAPIVLSVAQAKVRQANIDARRHIIDRSPDGRRRMLALAGGLKVAMLDFPLSGGLLLRDATRQEVSDQAAMYEKSGSDMLRKSRWLMAIAQSIPDQKKVEDVITEERVVELWEASNV